MFLNNKAVTAIELVITVFESKGYEVRYPDLEFNHGKVNISEVRWQVVDKMANRVGHILLTKWDGKQKIIVWEPKNPDEGCSAIDGYWTVNTTYIQLSISGQVTLPKKISADLFMTTTEMREYLGY